MLPTPAVSGLQVTGAMFTEVPRVCAVVDGVTRVTNVREDARTGRVRSAMIAENCKTYFKATCAAKEHETLSAPTNLLRYRTQGTRFQLQLTRSWRRCDTSRCFAFHQRSRQVALRRLSCVWICLGRDIDTGLDRWAVWHNHRGRDSSHWSRR